MDDNSQNYNENNISTSNNNKINYYDPTDRPMTIGNWIGTMLLCCIPIAGFILTIVWALSSDVNKSKKTYFQAIWILNLIIIGIVLILFFIISIIANNIY